MQTPVSVAGKLGRCRDCSEVMAIPCLPPASGAWADFQDSRIYLVSGAELAIMSDGLEAVRFSCLRCNKGLWLPNRQTHKKAECSGCGIVMRLSTAATVGTTSAEAVHLVDDSIRFKCPECQHGVHIESEFANKKGRCPECDAVIDIPGFSKMVRDSNPAPMLVEASGNDLFESLNHDDPLLAGGWDNSSGTVPTSAPRTIRSSRASRLAGPSRAPRAGLPWENEKHAGSRFWGTVRGVLLKPTETFAQMKLDAGAGRPIGFSLAGMLMGGVAVSVYYTIFMFIMMTQRQAELAGSGQEVDHTAFMRLLGFHVGAIMAAASVGQLLLNVILAAVHQMSLTLVQAARESLATTIGVLSYVMGSVGFTLIVLPLAPLALLIGIPRALKAASEEVHGATPGQANTALVLSASMIGAFVIMVLLVARQVSA